MKNYILLILICVTTFTSYSQSTGQIGTVTGQDFFQNADNYFVRDRSLATLDAIGSPFINEQFETAKFKRFGERIYNVRFNAYLGDIEVQTANGIIAVNKKQDFEVTFVQSNKVYKNFDYNDNGTVKKLFFVVVFENPNYSILKKESIKFRAEEAATTGYDKAKPATFSREDDVFYLKVGNDIKEVPNRKSKFLKFFSDQSKELKSHMKKENLNPRNDDELVKLILYAQELKDDQY